VCIGIHAISILHNVFAQKDQTGLEDTERLISNLMDLWTVTDLLARGESPELFRLQEQQYRLTAVDYRQTNVGREFPLLGFAEHCYDLRTKNEIGGAVSTGTALHGKVQASLAAQLEGTRRQGSDSVDLPSRQDRRILYCPNLP
jgi:hypothetical protein